MHILVTGGAGFIGSHTCKALHKAGFVPVVFDNLSTGHEQSVKWGGLIKASLDNYDDIRAAFREYRPSAVIHFAASAYVGESVTHPAVYFRNNTCNSVNLLDAMLCEDIKSLVFSSSCATYGIPSSLPIDEAHPQVPINPYGESKLFVEKILLRYSLAYGFRSISLRYFNAAGADREGQLGEAHDPETHVIPLIIQTALGRRKHFSLYGADYNTKDGTAIRDYVHVSDLAQAHVLATRSLLRGAETVAINLGSERGCSIFELISAVEQRLKRRIPVEVGERRAGDPPVLLANSALARQTLGWTPLLSSLDEILETAIADQSSNRAWMVQKRQSYAGASKDSYKLSDGA